MRCLSVHRESHGQQKKLKALEPHARMIAEQFKAITGSCTRAFNGSGKYIKYWRRGRY